MATWIRFEKLNKVLGRKTEVWHVCPTEGNAAPIGEVRWYPAWRKYCYFAAPETVYEQVCLRDIAQFCESATEIHKSRAEEKRG